MTLLTQLQEDLTAAIKTKDEVTVSTLRFLLSGIHNAQIEKGGELTDEEVRLEIVGSAKKHRESIEAFASAGRDDLVAREEAQLAILVKYLPKPLSEGELANMVDEAIAAVGAKTVGDLGKVVKAVMGSAGSRAEGARVAEIARSKLAPDV